MGRQPCCDKLGVKKGPWTAEEDKKLINFILANGQCCWRAVPKLAGLKRCGKSCRLRWTNYLRPDLKRGLLTNEEEQLVIDLHARLGNRFISTPTSSCLAPFLHAFDKGMGVINMHRFRYPSIYTNILHAQKKVIDVIKRFLNLHMSSFNVFLINIIVDK